MDLKPCPFCGTNPTLNEDYDNHYVWCSECADASPIFPYPEEATKHWNTRPREDALRAEVDALKLALTKAERQFEFYANEHYRAGKYDKEKPIGTWPTCSAPPSKEHPMSELVEIVARAITCRYGNDPDGGVGESKNWTLYRFDALAALRAIEGAGYKVVGREATEEMLEALKSWDSEGYAGIWDAAFDAAPTVGGGE